MAFTAEATREEMRGHVRSIVALSEESRKAALVFAAKLLRLPVARVKQLYYGEARCIEAHEADQIRAYVHAATKLIEARAEYEAKRREFIATAHPLVLRLAPKALVGEDVPQAVAERKVAVRGRGR